MTKTVKTKKKATKIVVKVKPFSRLSKIEKRKSVARDVIFQVRKGVYTSKPGTYVNVMDMAAEDISSCQLNTLIQTGKVKCDCCAKGSLVLSFINKTNHLKFGEVNGTITENEDIKEKLSSIFSKDQLGLMEVAYEGDVVDDDNSYLFSTNDADYYDEGQNTEIANKAIRFYHNHLDPTKRLITIMKKIISNPKGEFTLR